jgi:hypothetical protein
VEIRTKLREIQGFRKTAKKERTTGEYLDAAVGFCLREFFRIPIQKIGVEVFFQGCVPKLRVVATRTTPCHEHHSKES